MVTRHFVLVALFPASVMAVLGGAHACGGSVSEPIDASLVRVDGGEQDEPVIFPPSDAATDPRPEREIPDANHKPTCDDVGKYPGFSSCCDGSYCAGWCSFGWWCYCDMSMTGCVWPLVCCKKGGCMTWDLCEEW